MGYLIPSKSSKSKFYVLVAFFVFSYNILIEVNNNTILGVLNAHEELITKTRIFNIWLKKV